MSVTCLKCSPWSQSVNNSVSECALVCRRKGLAGRIPSSRLESAATSAIPIPSQNLACARFPKDAGGPPVCLYLRTVQILVGGVQMCEGKKKDPSTIWSDWDFLTRLAQEFEHSRYILGWRQQPTEQDFDNSFRKARSGDLEPEAIKRADQHEYWRDAVLRDKKHPPQLQILNNAILYQDKTLDLHKSLVGLAPKFLRWLERNYPDKAVDEETLITGVKLRIVYMVFRNSPKWTEAQRTHTGWAKFFNRRNLWTEFKRSVGIKRWSKPTKEYIEGEGRAIGESHSERWERGTRLLSPLHQTILAAIEEIGETSQEHSGPELFRELAAKMGLPTEAIKDELSWIVNQLSSMDLDDLKGIGIAEDPEQLWNNTQSLSLLHQKIAAGIRENDSPDSLADIADRLRLSPKTVQKEIDWIRRHLDRDDLNRGR